MKSLSRISLFTLVVAGFFFVSADNADAQLFSRLFKGRQSDCCEPAPEPVCCPEPEPEPVCCPEPTPEPAPVCCPEPTPEPVCCPEPAPEPAPCGCAAATEPAAAETVAATEAPSPYNAPELAEGEVLISVSPIEVPTDAGQTVTAATADQ